MQSRTWAEPAPRMRHSTWQSVRVAIWGALLLFAAYWLVVFFGLYVVGGFLHGTISDMNGCGDVSTPNGC